VHQVVQVLRSGTLVIPGFGRVKGQRIALVGFSLGSFIATIEASTYDDVDGVILTGYSHTVGPAAEASFDAVYPAALDPKFAELGLPPDYLTTIPGTRPGLFFHLPGVDPANLALDEELKQTVTVGEFGDIFPSLPASTGVNVPTLLVVGDFDFIACQEPSCSESDSLENEAAFFAPEACLEIDVVPDAGHSLNLHRNARDWFAIARDWSDRWLGPSTKVALPPSCI
jgi:pimeloyl-ACP methyl ester carboxylesterase